MDEFQYMNQPEEEAAQQQAAPQTQQQQPAAQNPQGERRRLVRQATAGKRFCRNCGGEIQAGASVCIHCNAVLNPLAIKKAQEIVMNRKATVTRSMLVKSFLFPGKGKQYISENITARPQVAEPCRKALWAGRIFRIAAAAAIVALIILL